jgi:hypothetical protein
LTTFGAPSVVVETWTWYTLGASNGSRSTLKTWSPLSGASTIPPELLADLVVRGVEVLDLHAGSGPAGVVEVQVADQVWVDVAVGLGMPVELAAVERGAEAVPVGPEVDALVARRVSPAPPRRGTRTIPSA